VQRLRARPDQNTQGLEERDLMGDRTQVQRIEGDTVNPVTKLGLLLPALLICLVGIALCGLLLVGVGELVIQML